MSSEQQSAGARLAPPPAWHGGVISMQHDTVVNARLAQTEASDER